MAKYYNGHMSESKIRILCVEDNRDSREMIATLLRGANPDYEVKAVETAAEAIAMNGRNLSADGVGDGHLWVHCRLPIFPSGRWDQISVNSALAGGVAASPSSTGGGVRFGASFSSAIRARRSRASWASRCLFHILA